MRKIMSAFLCLMIISAGVLAGCSQETSATNTSVSTQVVKNGNLIIGLYADGRITLPVTNLNFEVSGTVKSIYVIPNQVVNAGDLLAELDDDERNLEESKLYAPESGKIINIAYRVGEFLTARTSTTASGTMSSSSDFITLLDQSAVYLSVDVTEGDILGIEVGQTMRVAVDALGVENLIGSVVSISNIPKIDNAGIVTYKVTGMLDNYEERIMDGMSCFVTFVKKEKTDVLLVSNKAVFVEEGKQYVIVQLDDGTMDKREVVCGLSDGIKSEVIKGLVAGDVVVIGGLS